MTRLVSRLLVGLAVTAGASVAVTATPATAQASFRAVAASTTVSADYSNPDVLPLGAVLHVAGQTAQATLDQLGTSTGFASHPYPGDFVVGAPGLVRGSGVPAPDYPFYVSSDQVNRPSAKSSGPGYSLEAVSKEHSSTAEGRGSLGDTEDFRTGRGSASVATAVETGAVTARATTEVDSVSVAGVLRFGRVSSVVTVSRDSTGRLARSSSLIVEGATVAGQGVAVVDGELVVEPTRQPLAESPLAQALMDAGVTITTTAPTDTEDGRIGGALIVTVTRAAEGVGTSAGSYRLGGAAAFVSYATQAVPLSDGGVFVPPSAPPPTGTGASAVDPPAATVGSGTLAGSGELSGVTDVVDPPAVAAPTSAGTGPFEVAAGVPQLGDAAWLYFAFVASAAALFGSAQLIRQYGVKARL